MHFFPRGIYMVESYKMRLCISIMVISLHLERLSNAIHVNAKKSIEIAL